jgi:hypothetical protein
MDLISDCKEIKKIVKQRIVENGLSLHLLCKENRLDYELMFKWLNDDRFNGNIQKSVLVITRVLAIEVKITIRTHPESLIKKEKYTK